MASNSNPTKSFAEQIVEILHDPKVVNYKPSLNNQKSARNVKMNSQKRESMVSIIAAIYVPNYYSTIGTTNVTQLLKNAMCCYAKPPEIQGNKTKMSDLNERLTCLSERLQILTRDDPESLDLLDIQEEYDRVRGEADNLQTDSKGQINNSPSALAKRALMLLAKNTDASKIFFNELRAILTPHAVKLEKEQQEEYRMQSRYNNRDNNKRSDYRSDRTNQYHSDRNDRNDRYDRNDRNDRNDFADKKEREQAMKLAEEGKFIPPHLRKYLLKATEVQQIDQVRQDKSNRFTTFEQEQDQEQEHDTSSSPDIMGKHREESYVIPETVRNTVWGNKEKLASIREPPKSVIEVHETKNESIKDQDRDQDQYQDMDKHADKNVYIPIVPRTKAAKQTFIKSAWDDEDEFDDIFSFAGSSSNFDPYDDEETEWIEDQ